MANPVKDTTNPAPAAAPAAANAAAAVNSPLPQPANPAPAKPAAAVNPPAPAAPVKAAPAVNPGAQTPSNPAPANQAQLQGMLNKVAAGQVLTAEESKQYNDYVAANGKTPVVAGVPQPQGAGAAAQPGAQPNPTPVNKPAGNAQPAAPVAEAGTPEMSMKDVEDLKREKEDLIREANILKDSQVQGEVEARDALTQIAENTYQSQVQQAASAEQLYAQVLAQRNAAMEAAAQIERNDAEISYQAQKFELEETRKREQQAFNTKIVEQKLNNTNRTLQQESMMAALGGFGSLWANKETQDLTLQNDRVLNEIFFEKEAADENMAFNINQVTSNYQNDLFKIESNKQQLINQNYTEYMGYLNDVQNRRDIAETEKRNLIIGAQAQYKQNVSAINAAAFETRYQISTQARQYADQIRGQIVQQNDKKQQDARTALSSLMTGFSSSSEPLSTAMIKKLSELEKSANMPVGTASAIIKGAKEELKKKDVSVSTANDDGDLVFISTDMSSGKPVIKEIGRMAGMGTSAGSEQYQMVTQKDMYGNEYTIAVNKANPNDRIDLRTGLQSSAGATQSSGSATTSNTGGMKVINALDPNGDNCVLFARRFVPNLPTGLFTKEDKQAAVKKYGSTDMSQVKEGDAILTGEGTAGHVAIVAKKNGNKITLKEANYKSGMVTEGRELDITDPLIYGFISKDGSAPKSVNSSSSGQEGQDAAVESTTTPEQSAMTPRLPAKLKADVEKISAAFHNEKPVIKYNTAATDAKYALTIDPKTQNPADNQALISAFAKVMDPESVVREGEYATIQKYSQSWIESFGFNAARVFDNQEFLSEEAIKNLQKTIGDKFKVIEAGYNNVYNETARLIEKSANSQGTQFLKPGEGGAFLKDYKFNAPMSSSGAAQLNSQAQVIPANGRPPLGSFEQQ